MSEHKFTNRLAEETSPYLLQHAHNPVEWYPWGEEALERARQENKPILLSIGYSACHWCHVMERESFESEATAQLMNRYFINIKVDREERPDLDQIYMNAVQLMTERGGWPLTMFLTPELVPFYGGTYFPPEDRYGMPGFPRVLESIAAAYRERPEDVREAAAGIFAELKRIASVTSADGDLAIEQLDKAYEALRRNYDRVHGGFGSAPKFPPSATLEFMLRVYHHTGNQDALEMVKHTCRQMAEGGMYDQLGGGFHRYSTDERWLVPHFEKMLYDNALLARLYLHVFQVTNDDFYRRIACETLDYVLREMTDAQGGFYSAQDADSEGEEGRFFVWSHREVEETIGAEDALVFSRYYDVTSQGNFEGHNIFHVTETLEETASASNKSLDEVASILARGRRLLFERREKRVKPERDEKVLTSWNGLMLTALAEASAILDRADYLKVAEQNAEFILNTLWQDGNLLHSFKDGRARFNGYIDDYAFFARGLIALYEANGKLKSLNGAVEITNRMVEGFWDDEHGGFFFTADNHEQLIVRTKDYYDNATPSGNSVAAELMLRLAELTDVENYRHRATIILRAISEPLKHYPSAFAHALGALDFQLAAGEQIVIVYPPIAHESHKAHESDSSHSLASAAWKPYLPNKILIQAVEGDETAIRRLPLLRGRTIINNSPTAYPCVNRSCLLPTNSRDELARQLIDRTPGSTD